MDRRLWMLVMAFFLYGAGVGIVDPASRVGSMGMAPEPGQAEKAAPPKPVVVPEGNGVPVITDGNFGPGEWDDALRIPLSEAVELNLKQYRGVAFIGVRGLNRAMIGASELSISVPGGPIHLLHVSAQLGEVVLPPSGDAPPFRFGFTPDWYANEQRRDMRESERLEKEGKNPMEVLAATSYPSDGIEFAIRLSKFPGPRWLLRLGASFLAGGKPGWLVYPAAAAERSTEGWLEIRFK
jgi:hypothetical protein